MNCARCGERPASFTYDGINHYYFCPDKLCRNYFVPKLTEQGWKMINTMQATIKDIAHASNHDELMKAILKHKDVLRECM